MSDHRVIVTGPPRSGTRIASKIIAHRMGYRYVDEHEYEDGWDRDKWRELVRQHQVVVQSPGPPMEWILEDPPARAMVVMMRRDVVDIRASAVRLLRNRVQKPGHVDVMRPRQNYDVYYLYDLWDMAQKSFEHMDLAYESLATDPMWVPADERMDFAVDQTC